MEKNLLASYVEAMSNAAEIINDENPDYVVAPMLGSVPLIDAMSIVSDFDYSKVVYMPASSRVNQIEKVICEWYANFLDDVVNVPYNFPNILGIDEVVSGNSVKRCFKSVDSAIQRKRKKIRQSLIEKVHSPNQKISLQAVRDVDILTDNQHAYDLSKIRERIKKGTYKENKSLLRDNSKLFVNIVRDYLSNQLNYKTVGIEDSKKKGNRHAEYNELKEEGRVIPVEVAKILTMDKPIYCTARYRELGVPKGKEGYVKFSPIVKDFVITPEYMNFLRNLATYVGKDPKEVHPINMSSILDSSKYLNNSFN